MQRLVLGSQSPRRLQLLHEHGFEPHVTLPRIDDGEFAIGAMMPNKWVESLAILKARDVLEQCDGNDVVLTADTVCIMHNHVYGQPVHRDDAKAMLISMRECTHTVSTGWCIADCNGHASGVENATIHIDAISDDDIDTYVQSDLWKGKAGGYNVIERIEAGWPITIDGDMTCVMGLPMQLLQPLLSKRLKTT